jgi:hypothetical protein
VLSKWFFEDSEERLGRAEGENCIRIGDASIHTDFRRILVLTARDHVELCPKVHSNPMAG